MGMEELRIGTYHVPEAREFEVGQEYAGYDERILVPAGDYPVMLNPPGRGLRPYLSVSLPGTVASWYYGATDYGPQPGAKYPSRTAGQPGRAHLQPYSYIVAGEAAAETGLYTLTAGWSTKQIAMVEHYGDTPATPLYALIAPDGSEFH